MSNILINQYYNNIERGLWFGKSRNEKKPSDPTIAEKLITYRFTNYKEKVKDLILRVTTVSVETMKIIKQMEEEKG